MFGGTLNLAQSICHSAPENAQLYLYCVHCMLSSDGNLSESEVELDGEHNEVTLPQDLPGRGNTKSAKSAIR